jgi:alanyl-tRNA synthetase
LGDHVAQKGSLVAAERLRFDVSHPKAMTTDELSTVEDQVNIQVRGNSEVTTRLMTPEEAIEAGAMALFGEKYGDEVRVVSMGYAGGSIEGNQAYSTELCGGTHARRTGDIGLFRIISESAVAAGVRRIEAVTGAAAQSYIAEEAKALSDAAAVLKVSPADVPGRIESLMDERRKLEKEVTELRRQLATGGSGGSASDVKEIAGTKFLGKILDNVPAKDLKSLADDFKGQVGSGVVALISVNDGKASLVIGVTDDLVDNFSAVDLVKAGSEAVGGKGGGGRPDMAQAGGPDGGKADAALAAIEDAIFASA